jgi:TolB-like protein
VRIRPLAVGLAGIATFLAAAAGAGEPVRIALLPMAVNAHSSGTEYLSSGLAAMLSARLEQFEGVVVVRVNGKGDPVTKTAAAVEAGRAVDASFVLFGSFTQFGEGASLDVRCLRVGEDVGEPRRIFVQSGRVEEIIPSLDGLAEKIARYALGHDGGTGGRSIEDNGVPAAASAGPSLEEYNELLDRLEALEGAVYTPVASGDTAAIESGEADSSGSELR